MVVELLDLNLPCDPVRVAVLNLDRQVSTIVESTELTSRNDSSLGSTSFWGKSSGLLLGLVQRADFASTSLTFLCVVCLKR